MHGLPPGPHPCVLIYFRFGSVRRSFRLSAQSVKMPSFQRGEESHLYRLSGNLYGLSVDHYYIEVMGRWPRGRRHNDVYDSLLAVQRVIC